MGLGDFFEGAGNAIVNAGKDTWHAYDNAVQSGTAAIDRLLQGPVKKGIEHPEGVPNQVWNANREFGEAGVAVTKGLAKGGQFVVQHPVESYKIGNEISRQIIMDQLKPENIVTNVALALTSGGTSLLAKGAEAGYSGYKAYKGGASVVEGARAAKTVLKGARTADEIAAGLKGGEAASGFFSGPTKYATGAADTEKGIGATLGRIGNAKAAAVGDMREMVGLGRMSRFQEGRAYYGEQIASRFPGAVGENAGRMVAASPGAPMTGGRFAEMMYEGRSGVGLAKNAKTARTGLHLAADPEQFAQQQFSAHKDEITDFATTQAKKQGIDNLGDMAQNKAVSTAKDKLLNADEDTGDDSTQSTVRQPQAQVTPGLNWSAPDTTGGFVATPHKARSRGAVTTTTPSTMSGDVGPSNWYGGQNTYGSGRGFGAKPFGTTPWQKDPALT